MYIDAEVMKDCLKRLDNLNKGRISKRFSYTKSVFDEMEGIEVKIDEFPKVDKWEDEKIKSLGSDIGRNIFSPCNIGLTDDKRYGGVLLQKKYFEDERFDEKIIKGGGFLDSKKRGELVKDVLSIIGGFDSRGKMKDEYRILSNAKTSKNDFDSTLQSNGQYAWINSHFADNTLFCEFVDFVQKCQKNDTQVEAKWYENIALCYPYADNDEKIGKLSGKLTDSFNNIVSQEKNKQQELLAYRFPLKFLWMWANRNTVIHPLSLMAFRELLKSDFMKSVFDSNKSALEQLPYDTDENGEGRCLGTQISSYAKKITNANIEYFPKIWETISCLIKKELDYDDVEKVSLFISLLTLSETNMTNIDELLKTHKQIILYGVPGTGKTHSAKELIREWGKIAQLQQSQTSDQAKADAEKKVEKKHDILKDWHFSNFKNGKDSPIVWEIMQFHPNTTYQDFIGGIIPKTGQDKNLIYEVESGKFKKFCECAGKEENKNKKFVFIIDEINRANLSEVLGELLYALEYRDEGITIPNFDNKPFVIPSNVYIIGTMNNVDKSLSTFDLALRRRFGFYEIGIDCEVIEKMLDGKVEKDCLEKYIERCQDLNALISGDFDEEDEERLSKEKANALGLEKHYKIGQAYFAKIEKFFESNESNEITPIHLTKLWDYHLQPLIEEYIGFSMGNQEISNKLDNLKAFWIRELK